MNEKQKRKSFKIPSALHLRNQNDSFLNRIVTCDEKWILYDNRKRSEQWLDADKAPQQFPKQKFHQKKVMVIVWWSSGDLVHHNFIKLGETITAEKYYRKIDQMYQKLTYI